MFESLRPHGLQPATLLCPWDSPVHWSGLPFPSPEGLPHPRIKPMSLMSPGLRWSPGGGHGNQLQYSCHKQKSLVGYSPRDCKDWDTTEQLSTALWGILGLGAPHQKGMFRVVEHWNQKWRLMENDDDNTIDTGDTAHKEQSEPLE